MRITHGQARYLLAIHQMRIRERNMSKLAEILDVSKPSVTNMLSALEEKKWIRKGPPIKLTEHGQAMIEEISEKQALLTGYFSKELGVSGEEISDDVLVLIMSVSDLFAKSLTNKVESDSALEILDATEDNIHLTNFQGILEDGVYELPFRLLKENKEIPSMGDKGLIHPAKLVVVNNYGIIKLRVKTLKHKTLHGSFMKGTLSQLLYWNGTEFAEANEKDYVYSFPVIGMCWKHDKEMKLDYGFVKIKARASVGSVNMPDSVADLAIYV